MFKKNITVISSILFLISFRSYGQTIHQDTIYDFTAILITTPHQEPERWPIGRKFEKYVSLRDSFYLHTTAPNPSSEIFFQPFPNWHDSISIKTTVFVPPHTKEGFQLDIPEKEWRLIMLNNGGYESSTNYLTLWEVSGDSLIFQKLFSKPIRTGAGRFHPNYKINKSNELIFIYEGGTGDAGTLIETYFFMHIDDDQNLSFLLNKHTRSNYHDGGTRRLLLHEFLDERTLLVIVNTFNLTRKEGVHNRGFTYIYYDYELNDIKSEIINLEEQLKIANN